LTAPWPVPLPRLFWNAHANQRLRAGP
jgi:hypothetical protein